MNDRTLLDHYALRALGETFASAATRRDFARFETLWTPDAVWDLGDPFKVRYEGREAIAEGSRRLLSRWNFFAQMPHAFDAEIRGDTARGYWTVHTLFSDQEGFGGRTSIALYLDEMVRTPEGWRFAERRLRTLYSESATLEGRTLPPEPDALDWLEGGQGS
jgi:ketosteroid isomerase-like protein